MWNYRIVRHRAMKSVWYGLHEVYYGKKGNMTMWSPDPEAVGNDKDDLVGGLAIMLWDATNRQSPILNAYGMPGESPKVRGKTKGKRSQINEKAFFVRRTQNREDLPGNDRRIAYYTWDIYRRIENGDEFVAEFHSRRYALVSARALNLTADPDIRVWS